jgi:hypothetical protein
VSTYPEPKPLEDQKDYDRRVAAFQVSKRVDNEWATLMGNAGSRSRIWDLLKRSHQFQPIAAGPADEVIRRAAVRDFGLQLLNDLRRACPDQLALAERENQ